MPLRQTIGISLLVLLLPKYWHHRRVRRKTHGSITLISHGFGRPVGHRQLEPGETLLLKF